MRIILLTLVALFLLSACATTQTSDPADVVERYLDAKVKGDQAALQELLCLPMEASLTREAASFATVTNARIENMHCEHTSGTDIVQCTGQIIATYGTEDSTFDLTSYRVVQEDGEWKWCGEAG
jgi:ketosteroid isomerase-like protein